MRIFRWDVDFSPNKESVVAPVWIRIEGLPLYLFHAPSLWFIANAIGKPLLIDPYNLSRIKLNSAHICVELNVTTPLVDSIWITFEDDAAKTILEGFWVKVVYDVVPHYCTGCSHIRHDVEVCKRLKEGGLIDNLAQKGGEARIADQVFDRLPQPGHNAKLGIHSNSCLDDAATDLDKVDKQEGALHIIVVSRPALKSSALEAFADTQNRPQQVAVDQQSDKVDGKGDAADSSCIGGTTMGGSDVAYSDQISLNDEGPKMQQNEVLRCGVAAQQIQQSINFVPQLDGTSQERLVRNQAPQVRHVQLPQVHHQLHGSICLVSRGLEGYAKTSTTIEVAKGFSTPKIAKKPHTIKSPRSWALIVEEEEQLSQKSA
ncbi:hypothetical protein LIER_21013 [Lithospermum erythrorhizon]|uniref:DUF4283 domain-containing protein n=1 Tax=Lithospermum erythrorhizon TaxID=34254 RepID=A0AAV3QSR9_LITER